MDGNLASQKDKFCPKYFREFQPNFDDKILRAHNRQVYKKILRGFTKSNKVLAVQATGTGKSFLMMKLLKDHLDKDMRAIFVSPTLAIQNYFLGYCERFLGYKKGRGGQLNLVARQYAGLKKVVAEHFDIIILDEVHRIGATVWGENVGLLLKNNPNALVLGMTATLDRADKVDVSQHFDNNKPVSKLTLIEAIKSGILPSPDYTLSKIDYRDDQKFLEHNLSELQQKVEFLHGKEREKVKSLIKDLQQADISIRQNKTIPEIFEQKLKGRSTSSLKFIVFCPVGKNDEEDEASQLKMEEIMTDARGWFTLVNRAAPQLFAVHSLYGAEKNRAQIREFRDNNSDGIKLLFAVNMLNEGLHIADIDGVIMLRNTASKTIYMQQLGRALSVGHKSRPMIFDFVANMNYVDAASIINFAKEVNASTQKGVEPLFRLNIESLASIRFIDKIKQKLFAYNHRFDYDFDDYFARLQRYKSEHGDCKISVNYKDDDGYPLGVKTAGIRTKNIKITQKEQKMLENCGFLWGVRGNLMAEYIFELREFVAKFGSARVPHNYISPNGYPLGVKTTCVRSGAIQSTEADKLDLSRLGFEWKVYRNLGAEFIAEYRYFVASHKTKNVPISYVAPNGYKLGARVRSLRSGRMKITPEQRAELDELGFVWEVRGHLIKEYLIQLRLYRDKFGSANVPMNFVTDNGYPLGQKTKLIRTGGIATTISEIESLEKLGFIWDLHQANFDNFVEELREYKRSNKDCRVKISYQSPSGYPLGRKVTQMRKNEANLTEKEHRILDRLGFVWTVKK